MQNLDKVAIVGALLFLVVGISWPLFMAEETTDPNEVRELGEQLEAKIEEQEFDAHPEPEWSKEYRSRFAISVNGGGDGSFGAWSHYRRAAMARTFVRETTIPPVHKSGWIGGVKIERDAELQRAVHVVTGRGPIVERAGIVEVTLEIQKEADEEGKEEPWQTEKKLELSSGESFSVRVTEREAGPRYRYRIRSVAKPAKTSDMGDFKGTMTSENMDEFVLMPLNEIWELAGAQAPTANRPQAEATLRRTVWDYEKGRATSKNEYRVPDIFDRQDKEKWKSGQKLFGTDYRLYQLRNLGSDRSRPAKAYLRDPEDKLERKELERGAEPPKLTGPDFDGGADPEAVPDEPDERDGMEDDSDDEDEDY